jgi:hypothetical protein
VKSLKQIRNDASTHSDSKAAPRSPQPVTRPGRNTPRAENASNQKDTRGARTGLETIQCQVAPETGPYDGFAKAAHR